MLRLKRADHRDAVTTRTARLSAWIIAAVVAAFATVGGLSASASAATPPIPGFEISVQDASGASTTDGAITVTATTAPDGTYDVSIYNQTDLAGFGQITVPGGNAYTGTGLDARTYTVIVRNNSDQSEVGRDLNVVVGVSTGAQATVAVSFAGPTACYPDNGSVQDVPFSVTNGPVAQDITVTLVDSGVATLIDTVVPHAAGQTNDSALVAVDIIFGHTYVLTATGAIGGTDSATWTAPALCDPVARISGPNRYATSAAISAASFDPGVPVAYVATGTNFPDALSGGPAGGIKGGPVLLVTPTSIPTEVAAELTRLQPARIEILGGTSSVSTAVETALGGYTSGPVDRLSGPNRYATSAAISAASFDPGVPVAYVATGVNFPDALSGGPAGGLKGGPVLLVTPTSIPSQVAAELTRLQPGRIVILGGTSSVSTAVETALGGYTSGPVDRLSGPNRYATSAAISAASFDPGVPVAYVATGVNFPDALSGGPAGGLKGGPVLLVTPTSIPSQVAAELTRLQPARIEILGGTSSVSTAVETALAAYIK